MIAALGIASGSLCDQAHAETSPTMIANALGDAARPDTDTARDGLRKPAETLAFVGLTPNAIIADYAAGSGYFTRLFASVVGPSGHVYASVPSPLFQYKNIVKGTADIEAYAATHANVSLYFGSALNVARYPEKLDVFWISQNYHDLHDRFMGPVDIKRFNAAVFTALKPGGWYIVLDHVALAGSPADVTESLHRIDPATVRQEVEAAGFRFVAESHVLANSLDPHTTDPFDPAIQGHTDQFLFKFQKPK